MNISITKHEDQNQNSKIYAYNMPKKLNTILLFYKSVYEKL